MKNELNLREKQSVSAMVTLTFRFVKEHIVNLIKSVAILVLPWVLVASICIGFFYSKLGGMMGIDSTPDFSEARSLLALIPGCIFGYIGLIAFSATIASYMKLTLSHHKSEITLGMVSALVKKHFFKIFMGTLLFCIAFILIYAIIIAVIAMMQSIGLGIILGIFLFVAYCYSIIPLCIYAYPIIVEEKAQIEGIKRSFQLIRGYWWHSFGLIFLLSIIQSMLSYVIIIPVYIIFFLDSFSSIVSSGGDPNPEDMMSMMEMMGTVMPIIIVGTSFFYILSGVGFGVNYFSLVEIKEEVGLKEEIASMSEETKKDEA